ncbi:MAG: murein L,D-transpeptidase catalytic domain family protein [Flavisolibacter sp.]|jgi:hypothetical protein|nr:murein L,D-transpeptidase catalytic domain family protein [Flavisolibacter sp.]
MKKFFVKILLLTGLVSTSFNSSASDFSVTSLSLFNFNNNSLISQLYDGLDLGEFGLERDALDRAIKGYESLVEKGIVRNAQYLTVIDFSQPLVNRRFYLIDVENQELVLNTFVMHGKNSGSEMAEKFSNKLNSNQSSLGFYVTKQSYNGSRGYSLRLAGLEKEFNSNAEARGVVLHGSQYINEQRASAGKVERSLGCPAIPQSENLDVINRIKEGSLLFIYYPDEKYLQRSQVLNEL